MKRLAIGCALVGVLAVLLAIGLLALMAIAECQNGKVTRCNYDKVKAGMTVREAETFLGLSQESSEEWVPSERRPEGVARVVSGDKYFHWEDKTTARDVWVGVRNGKIINKWYWEPSF
jgi:hypothetical protein